MRWPCELHPSSRLPPSIAPVPGIAAVPWEAVHSLPAAGSQEWLWLSLGGEKGFFKRRWKIIQEDNPTAAWGSGTRQAALGKLHPWQSEPSWEESVHGWTRRAVVKNGKER